MLTETMPDSPIGYALQILMKGTLRRVHKDDNNARVRDSRGNGCCGRLLPEIANASFSNCFFVSHAREELEVVLPCRDDSAKSFARHARVQVPAGFIPRCFYLRLQRRMKILRADFAGKEAGLFERAHINFRMLFKVVEERVCSSFGCSHDKEIRNTHKGGQLHLFCRSADK